MLPKCDLNKPHGGHTHGSVGLESISHHGLSKLSHADRTVHEQACTVKANKLLVCLVHVSIHRLLRLKSMSRGPCVGLASCLLPTTF